MKKNTSKLNDLKNLNHLNNIQSQAIKGGDDKRPSRPPGTGDLPPGVPPGGVLPNGVTAPLI